MRNKHNKKILVTGGCGFLGKHVVQRLRKQGYKQVLTFTQKEYDLIEQSQVQKLLSDLQPQIIIHLAAYVGGISANIREPGRFFYDNMIMSALLMEEARKHSFSKFLPVGTVCSYPENPSLPSEKKKR